jgi:hypothetical protein
MQFAACIGNLAMCRMHSKHLALRKLLIMVQGAIGTHHIYTEIKAIEEGIYGARYEAD